MGWVPTDSVEMASVAWDESVFGIFVSVMGPARFTAVPVMLSVNVTVPVGASDGTNGGVFATIAVSVIGPPKTCGFAVDVTVIVGLTLLVCMKADRRVKTAPPSPASV